MTNPTIRIVTRIEVGDLHVDLVSDPQPAECVLLLGRDCFRRSEVLDHLIRNMIGRVDGALEVIAEKLKGET